MWRLASKSRKEESFESKASDSSNNEGGRRKEERLECPICWEPFNIVENTPYVLWCGHTICKYCLLGLQRAIVIKSSALPFHLPFFVACPWCNLLSLRLTCNGTVKFPSKNYYLLWLVESESRNDHKRVDSEEKDMNKIDNTTQESNRHGLWNGLTKSMALVVQLLAKFPLIVMFLLMALYAIPVSAAVLGVYFFVTFALAVPSFLVLYFAFPSLNWLIREITA